MHLLDANAFIEAARTYYPFDVAPGFWDWLGGEAASGRVGSVEAVKDEIKAPLELLSWASALPDTFWVADTQESLAATGELAAWANDDERPYLQAAIEEFMGSADLRLIGQALATGATVVTRERSAPTSQTSIKIPDVCRAFHIPCVSPFDAYRLLGLRLFS